MIAGRIREFGRDETISYEAINLWVDVKARELIPFLPHGDRKRQKPGHIRKYRKAHIPARNPIEKQPSCVESRQRSGDWEADAIIPRRGRTLPN